MSPVTHRTAAILKSYRKLAGFVPIWSAIIAATISVFTSCNGSTFSGDGSNKPAQTAATAPQNPATAASNVPPGIDTANIIGNGAACATNLAVALVMDVSGSMNLGVDGSGSLFPGFGPSPTNGGVTKIDVAKQAAQAFVNKFSKPDDMIGLVTFSDQAQIMAPMSKDRSTVLSAISQMSVVFGTNIPSGLTMGSGLFAGVPPGYLKIMILMSDGQNLSPGDPVATAATIKQSGVTILTLGYALLDGQSDMRAMASDPSYYFDSSNSATFLQNFNAISTKLCH